MKRFPFLLLFVFLFVQTGVGLEVVDVEKEIKEVKAKVAAITEKPFNGTVEKYPAYANGLGKEILTLADPLINRTDLSPENRAALVSIKQLGLALRYGFDDDSRP